MIYTETAAQAPTEAHRNEIAWCGKPTRPDVKSAKASDESTSLLVSQRFILNVLRQWCAQADEMHVQRDERVDSSRHKTS